MVAYVLGIATERVAMAAVPVEQAVQRYLVLRNHAVAAELGEIPSAYFAAHGVLAAAVQVATKPVEQAVQHYSRTCLTVFSCRVARL